MKLIEQEHIDRIKWDALVANTDDASCFSYSWYLDAVAENWCALVDESYTRGVALPYTKRVGIEQLYSPIFGRHIDVIGAITNKELSCLEDRFKIMEFACSDHLFGTAEARVHQVIDDFNNRKLGSQAKRSLKKAHQNHLKIVESANYREVLFVIEKELKNKFKGITDTSLNALEQLFLGASNAGGIRVFSVENQSVLGGIVCFEFNNKLLYVKGAVDAESRSNGAMYLALNAAIEFAKTNNLVFDFGGSNLDGVKNFNYNLGGKDQHYTMCTLNNSPSWFKWIKNIKDRFTRRKS